jgi:hypothetical protein
MKSFFRNLTLAFAAGTMGGLVNSLVVWLFRKGGHSCGTGSETRSCPDCTMALPPPGLGRHLGVSFRFAHFSQSTLCPGPLFQPLAFRGPALRRLPLSGKQGRTRARPRHPDPCFRPLLQRRLGADRSLLASDGGEELRAIVEEWNDEIMGKGHGTRPRAQGSKFMDTPTFQTGIPCTVRLAP